MPDSNKPRCKSSVLISASEIACYAYCPEQWRLEYGLKLPAENQKIRDAGTRHHRRKETAERLAGGMLRFGRLLAVIGLGVLLWQLWRYR